jgi:GAF domain-containing protein
VIEDLHIAVGDRISGWALAHKQAVLNSNATLELGPVARTFPVPLRYALAVPILNGPHVALGVLACYGTEPFEGDHQRIVESAATLFATALTSSSARAASTSHNPRLEDTRIH